ncbi:MAG: homoserine dehydrogenase [Candidatus Aminicenantales bacterium]
MKNVNIILMGYGHVGRAFLKLLKEKKEALRERYGIDLAVKAVFKSDGAACAADPLPLEPMIPVAPHGIEECAFWKRGVRLEDIIGAIEPGVLVDCTPSNLRSGEPALANLKTALDHAWNAVAASKGALVLRLKELSDLAAKRGVHLKYSGAAAAALPTLDIGAYALAGAEVLGIEGILNGTTNYLLTRMGDGLGYSEALQEAQAKGIAEPDPTMDVDGWDTACKLLIICNTIMETDFGLGEIQVEGVRNISGDLILKAKQLGKAIKLMGKCSKDHPDHPWKIEVGLVLLDPSHPLYGVSGTSKGITFYTDTMGPVTVTGGKSDPVGAAAAMLKDIINIYR